MSSFQGDVDEVPIVDGAALVTNTDMHTNGCVIEHALRLSKVVEEFLVVHAEMLFLNSGHFGRWFLFCGRFPLPGANSKKSRSTCKRYEAARLE